MPSAENADNIPEGSENAQPAIKPELLERMQEYFAKIQEGKLDEMLSFEETVKFRNLSV